MENNKRLVEGTRVTKGQARKGKQEGRGGSWKGGVDGEQIMYDA